MNSSTRRLSLSPKEAEHEDSEGSWAVSYGDMITLLLSFFVVFFTTDPQKEKVQRMSNHLGFELESLRPIYKGMVEQVTIMSNPIDYQEWKNLNIKAENVGDSIVITFGAVSFFDSGKTSLKESSLRILEAFAEKYLPYSGSYTLSIRGLTDKKPVTPGRHSYQDNLELSSLRSISAMRFFRKKGIPLKRMEIAGLGELKAIETILPNKDTLTPQEIDAISRTLVLVIKPDLGVIK